MCCALKLFSPEAGCFSSIRLFQGLMSPSPSPGQVIEDPMDSRRQTYRVALSNVAGSRIEAVSRKVRFQFVLVVIIMEENT